MPTSRFGTSAVGSARSKNSRFDAECSRSRPNGVLPLPTRRRNAGENTRVEVGVLDDQRAAGEVRVHDRTRSAAPSRPRRYGRSRLIRNVSVTVSSSSSSANRPSAWTSTPICSRKSPFSL